MKFAHIADIHLGNWRDPLLKKLVSDSFEKAINNIILLKPDFLLISGDLFHTALPGIDQVKLVVKKLNELKNKGIRTYYIAGSHDYSPSGKTMLDIIEEAELGINVTKGSIQDKKLNLEYTVDKTGAKITGIIGKKGNLEKQYYDTLNYDFLEKEEGFKIFMFHTAINELKPSYLKEMESSPAKILPKGFDYYAGGHVHIVQHEEIDNKRIFYPGPLFPANFSELEKLRHGGFYFYDNGKINWHPVKVKNVKVITLNINSSNSVDAVNIINREIEKTDVKDCIVLFKIEGYLEGTIKELNLKDKIKNLYSKGASHVLKNTSGLKTQRFEEVDIKKGSAEEIEHEIIKEYLGRYRNDFKDEEKITKNLMRIMSQEKQEGETIQSYKERIKKEINQELAYSKE